MGSLRNPRPGAPVIQIRSYNLMGGATIYRLPHQARGLSLKEARRLAKAADRGTLEARTRACFQTYERSVLMVYR
jgi:uncharacterized protein YicC (UPF0701 family)